MIESVIQLFSYPFFIRAFIVGILIALCAALLGVSLVLKRYAMIGDGLAHVGFGALSVALVMNWAPLYISIPVVIIAAFFLLQLSENSKIKGDAAIAVITSSALAIGIVVTSLATGMNIDVYHYMFGSILAVSKEDLQISIPLSIIVIILFIFFYQKIFAITFHENFAHAIGVKVKFYKIMLAVLTAITIVIGMRIMGTLLISSLIIFPALSSMRLFKSFRHVVISSAIISIVCFIFGIVLSYIFSTPAGASIVLTNLTCFLLFSLVAMLRGHATK